MSLSAISHRPIPPASAAAGAGAKPSPASHGPPKHPGLVNEVAKRRLQDGRIAEYTHGTPDPAVAAAGPPSYFRTYEQLKGDLGKLQQKYPDLVEVMDIGDSSEKVRGGADRDILSLRLTNKRAPAEAKTRVVHLAGEHAREIANPGLAMRWSEQLLDGYGRDPEATALLDTRVIDVIPMMNPDGHAVVERGYERNNSNDLWKRKNTTPPDGTDLNRNYDFHWGGAGASSNPRSETYRGASPASEPEVKAVQGFLGKDKPNMFIDWHSYSELVLYPWGDTKQKAPDHDGLRDVAHRFAEFNHYSPQQAIDLYPTTGTSTDWAYGEHRIPSWTLETGRSFHQNDREFERVWGENAPVFSYATKIADNPYERARGPEALDVMIPAQGKTLAAQISDRSAGNDAIAGAEWVLDPATPHGSGNPLTPADGRFDGPSELVNGDLSSLPAANGQQLVYVRARDAAGNWGPLSAQWSQPPAPAGNAAPSAPAQ